MFKTLIVFTFLNLILMFTVTVAQDNSEPADSLFTFEQFQQALPDSISSSIPSDSLKTLYNKCLDSGLNMPVIKPDTSLTASMPQLKAPSVDEDMIIPWFKNECSEWYTNP